jgi:predicted RNA-binding Zn-ribbon protein involved in translation (DUF1610 family)
MARKRISHAVRELARAGAANIGPTFRSDLECVNCGALLDATYTVPRERFPCPKCGRRSAIRCGEDGPYPLPTEPMEM